MYYYFSILNLARNAHVTVHTFSVSKPSSEMSSIRRKIWLNIILNKAVSSRSFTVYFILKHLYRNLSFYLNSSSNKTIYKDYGLNRSFQTNTSKSEAHIDRPCFKQRTPTAYVLGTTNAMTCVSSSRCPFWVAN